MTSSNAATTSVYVPPGSEATMGDVGRAVLRHWRWVAVPTLLALLGSLAFVLLVTPRYTGEARILLQASDSYFTRPANDRYEQQPLIDEQAVASQVQVIMSRDLAAQAIKRLNLVGNPEFDPAAGGFDLMQRLSELVGLARTPKSDDPTERVVERFYDHLLVYPVGKSRIVSIEFRSKDPELAARGANTVAELYLSLQDNAKRDQARSASTWLGSNIDELRKRVADSEAKVEAFRAKTGLLSGSGTTPLAAQQLSELSAQLAQARTNQSDSQSKAKLIRDLIRDGRTFDIPDVANNELIRRLLEQRVNLRAQLALELRTLLPQHPRIKELNAQLGDLENQIRGAADRTVRTLENDARIAGARVDALEAAVDAQKKTVAQGNESEVQLRALEREARTQREQLESYLGRFREATARDTDFGVPPDARIVSRAVAPQIPSFPKKVPIVAFTTLAAFMLSVGAIVAREMLTGRPAGSGAVVPYELAHATFGAPYPGAQTRDFQFDISHLRRGPGTMLDTRILPAMPDDMSAAPDPRYDFGELVRRLSRADVGTRGRRVLVTGLEKSEDVVNVARGLALTLAGSARVILVEADADEAHAVDARPGLTDLVAGEASFADVISRVPGSRLHRVAPGTLVNEALVRHPDGIGVALSAFEETYEWTICTVLGGPPKELLPLFAPRMDAVVIASNLEPANQDLVRAYEAAQEAGASDVIVAREHAPGGVDEAAAA